MSSVGTPRIDPTADLAEPRVAGPRQLSWSERCRPAERAAAAAAIERLVNSEDRDDVWLVEPLQGGASNMNFRVRRESGDFVLQVPGEDTGLLSGSRRFGLAVTGGGEGRRRPRRHRLQRPGRRLSRTVHRGLRRIERVDPPRGPRRARRSPSAAVARWS